MILIVNAGSSSVKLAVFEGGVEVARGQVSEIAGDGHRAAMTQALATTGARSSDLTAVAHRVVHGGAALVAPCRVTDAVMAAIAACVPLAPLHNPANLTGMRVMMELAPDVPQYASFDTAFHASNPDVATRYAIPQADHDAGIRRYGFHGLSYAAIVAGLRASGDLPRRLLAMHLGNGASLCAVLDGCSVATTMGYSPLDGLTMGSRSGAIDGNAVLALATLHGIAGAGDLLNRRAGLTALGGTNDMRLLHKAAPFAVDHFCYWAVRHAGSMIAAMGGLDGMIFTGGIGENDADVRARIVAGLSFMGAVIDPNANAANARVLQDARSDVAIWTVQAAEEAQIAAEALQVMAAEDA